MDQPPAPSSGSNRFAAIDFSEYIHRLTQNFTGREWVFGEIDHWLADPNAPRFFIITGEPGIGKSAVSARLTQIRNVVACHFCISREAPTIDPLSFVRSLSLQLAHIDGFTKHVIEAQGPQFKIEINVKENSGNIVGAAIGNLVVDSRSASEAFVRYVVDPLKRMYEDDFDQPILIVIDALDEAAQHPGLETIVSLLANMGGLVPQVRFVLTSRPERAVLSQFETLHVPHFLLDASHEENDQDVRNYVQQRLDNSKTLVARLTAHGIPPVAFVDAIATASQGNFLYLKLLIPEIEDGGRSVDNLSGLPKGLDEVYRDFLRTRKMGRDIEAYRLRYRPVLGLLSAGQEALSFEQIIQFSGMSRQELGDVLLDLKQFLDPAQAEIGLNQLFHQSVADFLDDQKRALEFWIELQPVHKAISQHYLDEFAKHAIKSGNTYCLRYLTTHLARAGLGGELDSLVLSQDWYLLSSGFDPSKRAFLSDLDLAFSSEANRLPVALSEAIANCFVKATLSGIARILPYEIYETLLRLGRANEAFHRAVAIPDPEIRTTVYKKLHALSCSLGQPPAAELTRLFGNPPTEDLSAPATPDELVLWFVRTYGVRDGLRQLSRTRIDPIPGSHSVKHQLEVARAAIALGLSSEAHQLLLECLDTITQMPEYEVREYLLNVAGLLLETGYDSDVFRVAQVAQVEFEPDRVLLSAQLALMCADSPDANLREQTLTLAINNVQDAKRFPQAQYPLSKIALSMAKVGDSRAAEYLQRALDQAQKPEQASWLWEEREAWAHLATAITSAGFVDQAMGLVRSRDLATQPAAERVVATMLATGHWRESLELAKLVFPFASRRALVTTGYRLASAAKLPNEQYQAIVELVEAIPDEDKSPTSQLATYEGLVALCLALHDMDRARRQTATMLDVIEQTNGELDSRWLPPIAAYVARVKDQQLWDRITPLVGRQHGNEANSAWVTSLVCRALRQVQNAWEAANSIPDSPMRLQAMVAIAKQAYEQSEWDERYFAESAQLASTERNIGHIPGIWGSLTVLAHKLNKPTKEVESLVELAIQGARTLDPEYHTDFNVYAVADVAEDFLDIDNRARVLELLEFGLTCFAARMTSADPLIRFAAVVGKARATALWDKVVEIARVIPDQNQKARAFIKIVYEASRSGHDKWAVGMLDQVVANVLSAGGGEYLISELEKLLLQSIARPNCATLSPLITSILFDIRTKDRPAILLWTGGLLSAIERCHPGTATAVWGRLQLAHDLVSKRAVVPRSGV